MTETERGSTSKAWAELEEFVREHVSGPALFHVFVPNFLDIFTGLGPFGFIDWLARAIAIVRGGIAPESLWVVTNERLHIWKLGRRLSLRWRVAEKVGEWSLDDVRAEPVKAKGMGRLSRPYAIRVWIDGGPRFEVQALVHDATTAAVIDALLENR